MFWRFVDVWVGGIAMSQYPIRWVGVIWFSVLFVMTNEPILPPLAPHHEGWEFPPEIDKYHGIVAEVVFQCLGKPVFFDQAVEMAVGRVAARMNSPKKRGT
jgi:hypothetical protein